MVRCKWCRKKIGTLRQFVDSEYCSRVHRKLAQTASARELRDVYDRYGGDEFQPLENLRKPQKNRPSAAGIAMLAGLLLLAVIWIPQAGRDSTSSNPRPDDHAQSGALWTRVRDRIMGPDRAALQLTADFQSGLSEWVSSRKSRSESAWVVKSTFIQPKELRLWTPSLNLRNYVFSFDASIDQKAVGCAFRAVDPDNYYATRIVLSQPAPFPQTEVVRYAVLNGQPGEPVQVPLPREAQMGTHYRVKVRIRGNQFETSINGTVVDSWQDTRLRAGGIGFFAGKGEVASILGVQLNEERGVLERIFLPAMLVPPLGL